MGRSANPGLAGWTAGRPHVNVIVAVLLGVWGSAALAAPPQYVLEWGGFGSGSGQFHIPRGISVADDGTVFVVDEINNRVEVFSAGGQYLSSWGTTSDAPDGFLSPQGVAVDKNGFLFATQAKTHTIQKFTRAGEFVTSWSFGNSGPKDLVASVDTVLYVAEMEAQRIHKLSSTTGATLGIIDLTSWVWGIALDGSGNVIVPNWSKNWVQKFGSGGQALLTFGTFGSGPGQFNQPIDAAVDVTGRIYVTDCGNHRIQVFDSGGQYLYEWGGYGTGPGEFRFPWAIAFGPDGDIYVTDSGNHRVQRFTFGVAVQVTTWSSIKAMYAGR